MTQATPWTRAFEKACRQWQAKLGLTDWTLRFKVEKGDGSRWAHVNYDLDCRQVQVISYPSKDPPHAAPERIALHEMLHILLADYVNVAASKGSDTHDDVVREEHRAIERLLNALDGRP
jgi:hypothetical protein